MFNKFFRYLGQLQIALSKKSCVIVFTMVSIFLSPFQWSFAQIYVDPCYDGSLQNGTVVFPFKTLTNAVDAAAPGSNIFMKGGIYLESITISKALTFTAYNGHAYVGGYGVGWQDVILNLSSGETTNARVYYPSWASTENSQIATPCSGETFPAIVYAHAYRPLSDLCSWCDDELRTDNTKDYLQAEGLLKRLASAGFIAISFDWHSVYDGHYNQTISPYVVDAISYLGTRFSGSINLQRIGLIGHSTGGPAVINAAELLRQNPSPPLVVVGLIAPAIPLHEEHLLDPVLVIHGTRETPWQVGTAPLNIYCKANVPKHLVVVTGANHFGYTDGICLDPNSGAEKPAVSPLDPFGFLPDDGGSDNFSMVGGLTGQQAQGLQQRTAGNYLWAFFSHYLQDNQDALNYLVQKQGSKCGFPSNEQQCDVWRADVFIRWPGSLPITPCQRAKIEIIDDTGILNTQYVDQSKNSGNWNYLGTFDFTASANVKISSPGGCTVIADAVKFVFLDSQSTVEIIKDAKLSGTTSGTWEASQQGNNIFGNDYLMSSDPGAWYWFSTKFSMELPLPDNEPVRYFTELEASNVKVGVYSCVNN